MQTCSTTILPVAQLAERETVRVALYLEVACSTQALENPFSQPLDLFFTDFPVCGIPCERRCSPDMEWNHHSKTCGVTKRLRKEDKLHTSFE